MTTTKPNFTIHDVLTLHGIENYDKNRPSLVITCPDPSCNGGKRDKKLNVDFKNNRWSCIKCGESGGIGKLHMFLKMKEPVPDEIDPKMSFRDFATDFRSGSFKPVDVQNVVYVKESDIADLDTLDATYRGLIEKLRLSPEHSEELQSKRGMSFEFIEERQYRSTVVTDFECKKIANELYFSDALQLEGIPGFYAEGEEEEWSLRRLLPGILIPIRKWTGKIQGFQYRIDKEVHKKNPNYPRFGWLSSADMPQGTRAETFAHTVGYPEYRMFLTEGPMKADIIHHHTGMSGIAIPGVNATKYALEDLKELYSLGVRILHIMFDMDMYQKFDENDKPMIDEEGNPVKNEQVEKALNRLTAELTEIGFQYKIEKWDYKYKGFDDLLIAKKEAKKGV